MKKLSLIMSALCTLGLSACTVNDNAAADIDEQLNDIAAEPDLQEKLIYTTDFSDWAKASAKAEESQVEQTTKYSKETLTFALFNTAVDPAGQNDKFNGGTPLGWLMAAKSDNPYILTSTLKSVTKVHYVHAATGSNRGWRLEAKGDGDADWAVLSETVANPAGWCDVTVDVNRENVQLRWANLNASQNAYMFQLDIWGTVDMGTEPALASFKVNGEAYEAADIFDENADGDMEATIEVSKQLPMISFQHPFTDIEAAKGKVGFVEYIPNDEGCRVTIPVTAFRVTKNFIVNVVKKPDFTLTYLDADGQKELGRQLVEKDDSIKAFAVGADKVSVGQGQAFRGWAQATSGSKNRKYTTGDIVTADLSVYALVTDIEVASPTARYEYALNDPYFYAEDHEAFASVGNGSYHDNQHGWAFQKGDQVQLLMGGRGYVQLSLCQYSGSGDIVMTDAKGNEVGKTAAKASTDGATATIEYSGEAGLVTLTFPGTTYVHNITIVNMAEMPYDKMGDWYVVKAGDASSFISTLEMALGQTSASKRTYIFLPDGTYDLGEKCLTQISGQNVSIIGQSMEGTVIVNHPTAEGIGITATLLNTSKNLYLQDLTLKNALDYFTASTAGRAVALQDKGQRTICKNVRLLSYQDTYYSNSNSQFYWETSEIHGVVDYICGGGDVFFNECRLVNESRSKTPKSGSVTIAAPYTDQSNKFGYVFHGCTIDNQAKEFNYGRAWGGVPRLAFINTTLLQPSEIAKTRFTLGGMNVAADKFVEYNTVDQGGNVVSPATNVLTFTKDKTANTYETILTADEAAGYALDKVFTDWQPQALAAQVEAPVVTNNGGELSWSAVSGAKFYAVFQGATLIAITEATTYKAADAAGSLTVRAINEMGGLSPLAL